MKLHFAFLITALAAGMVLPLQAGFNVIIGKAVNQPIFAAFLSFLIGSIALFIYLLFNKFEFQSMRQLSDVPSIAYIAGVLGAFYVAAVIILLPKIGASLTFSTVIAGQMIVSLFLDHFGLLGAHIRTFDFTKLVGVILLIAGVFLIRKN